MNIIVFASVDFPAGDATSSRVKLLAKTMIEGGNSVSLAIMSPNSKSPIPENLSVEGNFESIDYKYLNGTTVRPSGIINALKDSARGVLHSVPYILEMIKKKRADVLVFYTPDLFMILPALLIAKLNKIPVIHELCEINSTSRKTGVKAQLRRFGALATECLMPRVSSGVIAISSRIIDYLSCRGISTNKILHVPVLVEGAKFNHPSAALIAILKGRRYFLHSGTLEEKDGVEYVVKAFSAVARNHHDIYLVFTGKHQSGRMKGIVDMAMGQDIQCRILFTGFLAEKQLIWAYQNAEALLCCRSNSSYANYGFPTKLAEYLATGKPVITNGVGDTHLYLEHMKNSFMTNTEDIESIAHAMEAVLNNPESASLVGTRGQEVAREKFEYSNHVKRLKEFIENIVRTG